MSADRIKELLTRAEQIGTELDEIGVELWRLGEVHEARHIAAMLLAGDTTNCTDQCLLHRMNPALSWYPEERTTKEKE